MGLPYTIGYSRFLPPAPLVNSDSLSDYLLHYLH